MRSSIEEAIPILNKWWSESADIHVDAGDELRWALRLRGKVSNVTFDHEKLSGDVLVKGPLAELSICLTDALFEYAEPREAAPLLRERMESTLVSTLSVRIPGGEFFVLCEMRT